MPGYSGDGGQASSAQLSYAKSIALDAMGNIYIADSNNRLVRMVAKTSGIITTVAGGSNLGFKGDGEQATSAQLSESITIAVDASGNIYIADTDVSNNCIRKVTKSSGIISTVAGGGVAGYSGDGGLATSAQLNYPQSIAVDASGNIYIADTKNHRIRLVMKITGIISTVAGVDTQLLFPCSVAVDASGNIYIADMSTRIQMVVKRTGLTITVAGTGAPGYSGDGGQAVSAQLGVRSNIAVDASGNLYIADTANGRIRMVSKSTGIISAVAGSAVAGYSGDGGLATSAQLSYLISIAVDMSGDIYIAGSDSRVRMISPIVPSAAPTATTCDVGMYLAPGSSCAFCPAGTSSRSSSSILRCRISLWTNFEKLHPVLARLLRRCGIPLLHWPI